MFANIRNRFISVIVPDIPSLPSSASEPSLRSSAASYQLRLAQQQSLQDKFAYARPPFLQLLTADELRASADHNVRPIIVPRDISLLPWGTGYAECVNSGKSEWNEDQAAFFRQVLSHPTHKHPDLPYTYFGIFDGHAGFGAALAASNLFHYILHEKLVDCIDMLLPRDDEPNLTVSQNGFPHPNILYRRVNKDELIIGALESAFFHMDTLIAQDRNRYRDAGGCTACVALFINGKMYVANAGDSRAVLCQRKNSPTHNNADINIENNDAGASYPVPFSFDHTPETERPRLLNVAKLKPNLVAKYYIANEYARRPHEKDLGQRILCRQGTMKGWTYKTLTREDLRMPVVTGEGKRSRLLGTLGVTRGFGDHDLMAINSGYLIKPFLTPHPDVNYRDLSKIVSIPGENNEDGDYGVLVMATDGLWDVSENEAVANTVFQTLTKYPTEKHRYTMVAQELVAKARGKINDSGHWRLTDSKAAATVDDISVIVIPVYQYYKEHVEWEKKCAQEFKDRLEKESQVATEAKEVESTLTNGIQNARVDLDNDDDEEVVVEVNTTKMEKAQVEVEVEIERNSQLDTGAEETREEFDSNESDEKTLDDTIAALALTTFSTTDELDTTELSSGKTQKSKRNRNRKDNKQ